MGHDDISEDRWFMFDKQEVVVPDLDVDGYILDLGGGGEGVIGRLRPDQVVAIDPNRRELEGAAPGPLKVVMDARDLQFLDDTFAAATSFFTLMYIPGSDHAKVLAEVNRVLAPGAPFYIWDISLTPRCHREEDFAVYPLLVKLPTEDVDTGYGVRWPAAEQGLDHFRRLAEESGFDVVTVREAGRVLELHLRKPADR